MTDDELQQKYKDVRFFHEERLALELSGEVDEVVDWIEITRYRDTMQRFVNTKTGEIEERPYPKIDPETLRELDNKPQSYWNDMVRLANLRWKEQGR